jgi:hypothetical protein
MKLCVGICLSGLLAGCVFMVAGCSQNHGLATRTYLKTEHDLVATFFADNGRDPKIIAPSKPTLPRPATKAEFRQYTAARAQYPHELVLYYSNVIARLNRQSNALGQVQAQMGTINAAGVDPDAVHVIATEQALLGDGRLVLLEASKIYEERRAALVRGAQSNFFDDICVPAAVHAAETMSVAGAFWGAFEGLANVAGRSKQERQQIEELTDRFRESQTVTQRDAIALQTERSQILASLSSKYPGQDWNFLKIPGSTN